MCSIEDLDALTFALKKFESIRSDLCPGRRDINLYFSIEELLGAQKYQNSQELRAAREFQRKVAFAGSTILFADAKWRLVRLDTVEAARWWGRGTRWCTSSHNGQAFAAYHSRCTLLVLVSPVGRYQLAPHTGEFMDAADRPARLAVVLATAPAPLRRMLSPCRDIENLA